MVWVTSSLALNDLHLPFYPEQNSGVIKTNQCILNQFVFLPTHALQYNIVNDKHLRQCQFGNGINQIAHRKRWFGCDEPKWKLFASESLLSLSQLADTASPAAVHVSWWWTDVHTNRGSERRDAEQDSAWAGDTVIPVSSRLRPVRKVFIFYLLWHQYVGSYVSIHMVSIVCVFKSWSWLHCW